MNITELAAKLQKLINQEPALEQELKNLENLDQAIAPIVAAADRHGIPMDAAALTALLNAANESVMHGEIRDEALADLAGGVIMPDWPADFLKDFNSHFASLIRK